MTGLLQAFGEGFLNPLLVPAHALALAALGLFAGQQNRRAVLLLVFAAALVAGLVAIALAVGQTAARMVLLADAALLGILVAAAWAPLRPIGWLMAAIAGAALGLDSPPQAITIAEGNATLAGTALGACAMLFAVAGAASYAERGWQRLGVRILGSWIAASAILVLAVLIR
jgi:hypothetical protein